MRLSEFKDERAIEVVADLMGPIIEIISDPEIKKIKDEGKLVFAQAMLKNKPRAVMDMLAILNDTAPDEYHCSSASVLVDVFNLISDPELMTLFGLQGGTEASSSSASMTSEAEHH